MKQSSKAELRRQAKGILEEFSIPIYDKYDAGEVLYYFDEFAGPFGRECKDMPIAVTFTHKSTGRQITVGNIHWNEEDQEIMQVGSNCGTLEY
jgi:hypothetical protein